MNRFALLDSDDEETKAPSAPAVTVDKKKKAPVAAAASTSTAAPAAVPKKAETKPAASKPANNKTPVDKKPVPGSSNYKKADTAAPSSGGDVAGPDVVEKEHVQRNKGGHHKAPKTRFEKKQDEKDPLIKSNNRITGAARGITRRKPSKNANLVEADAAAKEATSEGAVDGEVVTEEEVTPEPVEEAEPEPPKLSFDEFQRQREQARAQSALLGEAKAARVVEDLSGMKIKEEDTTSLVYTGVSKGNSKVTKVNQRSTGKTVLTDLAFKVEAAPVVVESSSPRPDRNYTPRGGRGSGSGSPRTAGGRGSPSSKSVGSKKSAGIDISDTNLFPSL